MNEIAVWIAMRQRAFHDALTEALRSLAEGGGPAAAAGLIVAGFLYGVFHAAGPGHGKAILSTYLLTHRQDMARGLSLAVVSALCQGVSAIVIVYGLFVVAGWLPRDTTVAVTWSERLSYALVLLLGVYLTVRALRALYVARVAAASSPAHHHGDHDHGACGHAHGPSAEQIAVSGSLRERVAVVLSIGLRPCSGAVLVLVFAQISGLIWAGIASVLAMSLGTAMATGALAAVTVFTRDRAVQLAGTNAPRLATAGRLVTLAGGLLIVMIGYSLLAASWQPAHPLGLG